MCEGGGEGGRFVEKKGKIDKPGNKDNLSRGVNACDFCQNHQLSENIHKGEG